MRFISIIVLGLTKNFLTCSATPTEREDAVVQLSNTSESLLSGIEKMISDTRSSKKDIEVEKFKSKAYEKICSFVVFFKPLFADYFNIKANSNTEEVNNAIINKLKENNGLKSFNTRVETVLREGTKKLEVLQTQIVRGLQSTTKEDKELKDFFMNKDYFSNCNDIFKDIAASKTTDSIEKFKKNYVEKLFDDIYSIKKFLNKNVTDNGNMKYYFMAILFLL